ncbi:hypothetical protein RB195_008264 [Necator americanus]|uniref:FLYWCH-type domain-containing protein n=1 Tax=Necator americanus TaxID=51031 RepID=A0ABR1CNK1_NECAM
MLSELTTSTTQPFERRNQQSFLLSSARRGPAVQKCARFGVESKKTVLIPRKEVGWKYRQCSPRYNTINEISQGRENACYAGVQQNTRVARESVPRKGWCQTRVLFAQLSARRTTADVRDI